MNMQELFMQKQREMWLENENLIRACHKKQLPVLSHNIMTLTRTHIIIVKFWNEGYTVVDQKTGNRYQR